MTSSQELRQYMTLLEYIHPSKRTNTNKIFPREDRDALVALTHLEEVIKYVNNSSDIDHRYREEIARKIRKILLGLTGVAKNLK